jgi:hypothetical protein
MPTLVYRALMLTAIAAFFWFFASPAQAQSVQQSGNITPGFCAIWVTTGVINAEPCQSGPIVSIATFGGVGDGVTDNAAAFAAAVADLQASPTGGGTIYFPAGIFYASTSFAPPSNISLQGAGTTATVLKGNSACNPAPCNITLIIYAALTGTYLTATTYPINAPTQGTNTITTTTPSDAGNFSAGQVILISGGLHSTSFWYPDWTTTVVSANASTGVITLGETLPLGGSALSLVQQVLTYPHDISVSNMAIEGTVDGSVQLSVARNISFNNVKIIPSTDSMALGSLSVVASRDITVNQSFFEGGSYLECLGCFYFNYTANQLQGGSIAIDGGSQYGFIGYNNISTPSVNGVKEAGISIFSMSQYDTFVGNSISNVQASSLGIDIVGINGEGGHSIIGNNVTTVDTSTAICYGVTNSVGNNFVGNTCNTADLGLAISSNSTGQLAAANQFTNVTTPYNNDASSTFATPITPYKQVVANPAGTTPAVQTGSLAIFQFGATNITNFTGGTPGQIITVQFGDGNSSLIASGNLNLLQNTSFLSVPSGTVMQFIQLAAGNWYELSRTQVNIAAIVDVRGRTVNGLLTAGGGATISGTLNLNGISGAGSATQYVCADSTGKILLQSGAC